MLTSIFLVLFVFTTAISTVLVKHIAFAQIGQHQQQDPYLSYSYPSSTNTYSYLYEYLNPFVSFYTNPSQIQLPYITPYQLQQQQQNLVEQQSNNNNNAASVSQTITCTNGQCHVTTCVNGQCQEATVNGGTTSGGVHISQSSTNTCVNGQCSSTTCINDKCQTFSLS